MFTRILARIWLEFIQIWQKHTLQTFSCFTLFCLNFIYRRVNVFKKNTKIIASCISHLLPRYCYMGTLRLTVLTFGVLTFCCDRTRGCLSDHNNKHFRDFPRSSRKKSGSCFANFLQGFSCDIVCEIKTSIQRRTSVAQFRYVEIFYFGFAKIQRKINTLARLAVERTGLQNFMLAWIWFCLLFKLAFNYY